MVVYAGFTTRERVFDFVGFGVNLACKNVYYI